MFGDGSCDKIPGYDKLECIFEGGFFCDCFYNNFPNCKVEKTNLIGDGTCLDDPKYDSKECGYDCQGCCCSSTCSTDILCMQKLQEGMKYDSIGLVEGATMLTIICTCKSKALLSTLDLYTSLLTSNTTTNNTRQAGK